jgi:glycosyltransferase involved in cell wall biosynthesis
VLMVKVSVIIVNFNTGRFLRDCVVSLKSSVTGDYDYEVIVVDNNSNDDSLKHLKQTIVM